jgi:hypothetical protein
VPGVLLARPRTLDRSKLASLVEALCSAAMKHDVGQVRELLEATDLGLSSGYTNLAAQASTATPTEKGAVKRFAFQSHPGD